MLARHPEAFGSSLADWQDQPDSAFLARLTEAWVAGAFMDGVLVGLAAMNAERGERTRHRALVTMVYVRAAHRGTGAIDALLEALAGAGRRAGLVQLELMVAEDNAPAIAAYRRCGYQTVGTLPRALRQGDGFVAEHLMVRAL